MAGGGKVKRKNIDFHDLSYYNIQYSMSYKKGVKFMCCFNWNNCGRNCRCNCRGNWDNDHNNDRECRRREREAFRRGFRRGLRACQDNNNDDDDDEDLDF